MRDPCYFDAAVRIARLVLIIASARLQAATAFLSSKYSLAFLDTIRG